MLYLVFYTITNRFYAKQFVMQAGKTCNKASRGEIKYNTLREKVTEKHKTNVFPCQQTVRPREWVFVSHCQCRDPHLYCLLPRYFVPRATERVSRNILKDFKTKIYRFEFNNILLILQQVEHLHSIIRETFIAILWLYLSIRNGFKYTKSLLIRKHWGKCVKL